MAIKTDNSSVFKIIAAASALCVLLAAVLIYMKAGEGDSSATELAALSQALPAQARRALDGDDSAFDQLDNSVSKITALRGRGAPGRSSDWEQLESHAASILGKRNDIETMQSAANKNEPGCDSHPRAVE